MIRFYIFTLVFFVVSFFLEILFDEIKGQRGIFIFLASALLLISIGTGIAYGFCEKTLWGIVLYLIPYILVFVLAYFETDITNRIRKSKIQELINEIFGLD